jgi:hypothetical protein
MRESPIFRNGLSWRVDATGCERVVWPNSEAALAGAMAVREQAIDEQAAIERVKRRLLGERVGPGPQPRPSKPLPITVSNRCEYTRDGVRCSRRGSITHTGYRCVTHRLA